MAIRLHELVVEFVSYLGSLFTFSGEAWRDGWVVPRDGL